MKAKRVHRRRPLTGCTGEEANLRDFTTNSLIGKQKKVAVETRGGWSSVASVETAVGVYHALLPFWSILP
jgi:hypothetical protein